jgi:hypothetical protein
VSFEPLVSGSVAFEMSVLGRLRLHNVGVGLAAPTFVSFDTLTFGSRPCVVRYGGLWGRGASFGSFDGWGGGGQ